MADGYGARTVVCDNGSAFIKAAIVGGHEVTVPNVIGITNPFHNLVRDPDNDSIYMIGEYAALNSEFSRKIHPIVRGNIVDFNAMRRVWRHVFMNRLGIDPEECNLIITVPAQSDRDQLNQMAEIMMNEMNFRSILVASAPVLAFYSKYGNGADANGIVVDIGDSLTQVVPIFEGVCMDHAAIRINEIGGRDITDNLAELLSNQSHMLTHPTMRGFITHIKENNCLVENPYPYDQKFYVDTCSHRSLDHPVLLGREKYKCVELLFNPQGLASPPIDQGNGLIALIIGAINATSEPTLCKKILLSGGSSQFGGMQIRIISALSDYGFEPEQVIFSYGARSPLMGGCWLAERPNFRQLLTTREEFDEGEVQVEDRRI